MSLRQETLQCLTVDQQKMKLQEKDARIKALMEEMKDLKEAHMAIIDDSQEMEKELDTLTNDVKRQRFKVERSAE